jgi:chorismate mutase/prephenate dehydratase
VNEFVTETRAGIDTIDRDLLAIVNRRLELVRSLHDHKIAHGIPLHDPGREEAMLALLEDANTGPLSTAGVASLLDFVLGLTRRELHGE